MAVDLEKVPFWHGGGVSQLLVSNKEGHKDRGVVRLERALTAVAVACYATKPLDRLELCTCVHELLTKCGV